MKTEEKVQKLKDVKIGDQLATNVGSFSYYSYELIKVEGLTDSLIKSGDRRFKKVDGYEYGGSRSSWKPHRYVFVPDENDLKRIDAESKNRRLVDLRIRISNAEIEKINRVYEFLLKEDILKQ